MAEYFAFVTKEGQGAISYCVANPPATVMFKEMAVGDLDGVDFPAFWTVGTVYTAGTVVVGSDKSLYNCILNHTSTALDSPGVGVNWATYWTLRTTLIWERYRASVNAVYVHPNNPNWLVVEAVVPDDQGGWWIKEVGLYADPGTGPVLFGVAKYPPSYKPTLALGSGKDFYIRIVLVMSDISVISLIMDPSVVAPTQIYVNNYAYWATEADRLWSNVQFEGGVVSGDAVYFNNATGKFGKAVADGTVKQKVIGFADTTPNYRNPYGEIFIHGDCVLPFSPALVPGSTYYLSTTTPGAITSTPPNRYTVKVGTATHIGELLVDIDDILSGYEDIAFTSINSFGDIVTGRDLTVTRTVYGLDAFFTLTVQGFIVNATNNLNVGSEGGFPALTIDNAGDVHVTGGADSVWNFFKNGVDLISIQANQHIWFYDVSRPVFREMKEAKWNNAIVCARSDGYIDPSWIPPMAIGFPNTYIAPWGYLGASPYTDVTNQNPNTWEPLDLGGPTSGAFGVIIDYLVNRSSTPFTYYFALDANTAGVTFRLAAYDVEHGGPPNLSSQFLSPGNVEFSLTVTLPASNRIRLEIQCNLPGVGTFTVRKDAKNFPGEPIIFGYDMP